MAGAIQGQQPLVKETWSNRCRKKAALKGTGPLTQNLPDPSRLKPVLDAPGNVKKAKVEGLTVP